MTDTDLLGRRHRVLLDECCTYFERKLRARFDISTPTPGICDEWVSEMAIRDRAVLVTLDRQLARLHRGMVVLVRLADACGRVHPVPQAALCDGVRAAVKHKRALVDAPRGAVYPGTLKRPVRSSEDARLLKAKWVYYLPESP